MRFDKLLLELDYHRNLYISSSMRDEKAGDFWPKETDAEVAAMCIQLLLELGISVNLDGIPYDLSSLLRKAHYYKPVEKQPKMLRC